MKPSYLIALIVLLVFAGCAQPKYTGVGDNQVASFGEPVAVAAKAGDTVFVEYTGTLEDGSVFDSSVGRAPFEFVLGSGSVLELFDAGIQGMKLGEEKEIIIPEGKGYSSGPLAGKKMIFKVKLLKLGG